MTSNVVPLFRRVIERKDGTTYRIPDDDPGVPAEAFFASKGVELPKFLRNADARVYIMPDGKTVIARPE